MNYSSPTTYFLSAIAIILGINISATGMAFTISELTDYTNNGVFFEECINTVVLCVSVLMMTISIVSLGRFIKKLSE